jgi:4,5:9,10-diseco-3-hydroxy-5,9,17-trioxoandrosta-1(10),2-diene-4-oate hydrolase
MAAVHHGTRYSKEATDRYVDVDGIKIHYNEAGEGPALFCFHGGGPGANAWDNSKHNLDELAEHFRCILMDMPGYGLSDKTAKTGDTPSICFAPGSSLV